MARWMGNEKVLLLTFPDAATQRRALGRASMYLEDPEHRGRVAKALPAGARGVANYSGHNARVRELVAFYNAARGRWTRGVGGRTSDDGGVGGRRSGS